MSVLQEAPGIEAAAVDPASALVGLVLLAGGLTMTPMAVVLARVIVPERRVFFARWRFAHLAQVVLLALFATVVAAMAVSGIDGLPIVLKGLVATALGLGTSAVLVALQALRLDPSGLRSLGFMPGGHLRAVVVGLLGYVLCLPALIGTNLLWPYLWERLGGAWEAQEVALQLPGLSGGALALAVVLAIVVQPFLEELLFRGFLQPLLVQNLGDRGGIVLASIAFAALHGGSAFLPIFGLSLLLGAVMLRTQRLSGCFAVHALHNGILVALLLFSPETVDALLPEGEGAGLLGLLGVRP